MQISCYCLYCKHFLSEKLVVSESEITSIRCEAYLNGNIPDEILSASVDHRQPYLNDNGIIFSPKDSYWLLTEPKKLDLFKK